MCTYPLLGKVRRIQLNSKPVRFYYIITSHQNIFSGEQEATDTTKHPHAPNPNFITKKYTLYASSRACYATCTYIEIYLHIFVSLGIGIPEPEPSFCSSFSPYIKGFFANISPKWTYLAHCISCIYVSPRCVTVINTHRDLCADNCGYNITAAGASQL